MKLKILSLLLISMFCLVACQGAIDEQDEDFIDVDEPIAEEQEDVEEPDLEDETEDVDDEEADDAADVDEPEASVAEEEDDVEEDLDDAEPEELIDGDLTFIKKVSVFGVEIWATDSISDEQLLHAGGVMAQYLDNDADGEPDNPYITDVLVERKATLTMFEEAKRDNVDLEMVDELRGDAQQPLYLDQVLVGGNTTTSFDTTLEEVLHLITAHGWAYAYPEVWGETPGTELANAMDIARGGQFEQIPEEYPEEAWYSYYDETCDYVCMGVEYVYWAYTSLMGAQQYRLDEIEDEWRLGTAELLRETDTAIVELLTDPEFNFGTVLPDGNYTAMPIVVEPILIEDYLDAESDAAEDQDAADDEMADNPIRAFGDPNESHIGGTVLRQPVREAPDDIFTDSGIYYSDEFDIFTKVMEVYGLTFVAKDDMSDEFMLQVADTFKQMFAETPETDRALQEAVLKELYRYYAVLPIVTVAGVDEIGDLGGQESRTSPADIVMSDVEVGQANEVVEHLLHAVTSVGMHYALNEEFGLHEDSLATQAMQEATALGFYNYESGEPAGANDSKIRVQEYLYWVIITGWNFQERYFSGGDEWTIRNADALQAQQPAAYALFAEYIPLIMTLPSEETLQIFEGKAAGAAQEDDGQSAADLGFTPATFSVAGDTAVMSGVIDSSTPDTVQALIDEHPEVTRIVLQQVDGSVDDFANLIASRLVREHGFDTHVPSDGEISSGGVDFFLAGVERTVDDGGKLGVHSWASGDVAGADVPEDDPQHSLYLDYYAEMGIPADFYWFTLDAAPPDDIHWMSPDELAQYQMITQ